MSTLLNGNIAISDEEIKTTIEKGNRSYLSNKLQVKATKLQKLERKKDEEDVKCLDEL